MPRVAPLTHVKRSTPALGLPQTLVCTALKLQSLGLRGNLGGQPTELYTENPVSGHVEACLCGTTLLKMPNILPTLRVQCTPA